MPDAEMVRPGVWSLRVPIPGNPLGFTLVYLLESDRGPVLVDAGWHAAEAWTALVAAVGSTGHHIADVYGVLVTHHHPDHHGLSGRVRDASGAWIAMHAEDAQVVARYDEIDQHWRLRLGAALLQAGASEADIAAVPDGAALPPRPAPALPNRLVVDGERMDVPGWNVRALWTPGHSPGHTCFVVERYELLLAGDHVLPGISPHIGLYQESTDADPLGDYLASLRRLEDLRPAEVLPAHQHRFAPLAPRLVELRTHHEVRLSAVVDLLKPGPRTGWEVAERMRWNRPWSHLTPLMKRAALGEARAHLRCLEQRGLVKAVAGRSAPRYALAEAALTGHAEGSVTSP